MRVRPTRPWHAAEKCDAGSGRRGRQAGRPASRSPRQCHETDWRPRSRPYRARPRLAQDHQSGAPPSAGEAHKAGWRRISRISDRWRRSLQLRVVTATLVLSAVGVSVLGYVLMQHLVTELYNDKVQSSVNIVDNGVATASSEPAFNHQPDSSTANAMNALAGQLRSAGGTPYALEVTLPLANQGPPVYSGGQSVGFYGYRPALPQV